MSYSVKKVPGHAVQRLGVGGLIQITKKESAEANSRVDHKGLSSILHQHNLIPPSHTEIFSSIFLDPNLKKKLKGSFLYLRRMSNLSTLPNGTYFLEEDQESGQLKQDRVIPGSTDPERTVKIWQGNNPPALFVLSDESTKVQKVRFIIDMAISPSFSTETIMGVEPNPEVVLKGGSERILPASLPELIKAQQEAIAELRRLENKYPNSTTLARRFIDILTNALHLRPEDWF